MTGVNLSWHPPLVIGEAIDVNSESGRRLKKARERAGFQTAAEACRKFQWNASTYRAHENGQNGLSEEAARRYAEGFGADWEWLMAIEAGGASPNIKGSESAFKGKWKVRPEPVIWASAINTALIELGVEQEKAERVTEVILSVAFAQLPAGLGLSEEELARQLVQTGMRKHGLSIQ